MKLIALCLSAMLIAGVASGATPLPQTVETSDNFTMSLPAEWIQIPRDVLDAYMKKMAELAPQAPKQTFEYGFQLKTPAGWFHYPYMLVQVRNIGRVPEAELKSLPRVENALREGIKQAETGAKSLCAEMSVNKTYYDSDSHILWTQVSTEVVNVGTVRGVMAMILTERGIIQVMCYARSAEFEQYAPMFEEIARNVRVGETIRYRPKLTDSIPPVLRSPLGRIVILAVIGGVIGGVYGMVAALRRKRRTEPSRIGAA